MSKMAKENKVFKVKMLIHLPSFTYTVWFSPSHSLKITLPFQGAFSPKTTASLPKPPVLLMITLLVPQNSFDHF